MAHANADAMSLDDKATAMAPAEKAKGFYVESDVKTKKCMVTDKAADGKMMMDVGTKMYDTQGNAEKARGMLEVCGDTTMARAERAPKGVDRRSALWTRTGRGTDQAGQARAKKEGENGRDGTQAERGEERAGEDPGKDHTHGEGAGQIEQIDDAAHDANANEGVPAGTERLTEFGTPDSGNGCHQSSISVKG